MACVPHLIAAALAASAPSGAAADAGHGVVSAIYTSPLPACDGLGLADEDGEVAARDTMREGEPLTPAGGFDTRDCKLPDKAPAIVDCNDARAGVWVHEMVGTCDMPVVRSHATAHLLLPRDRYHAPTVSWCAGASCSSDTLPLRSVSRGLDDSPWMALEAAAHPPVFHVRRLDERRDPDPTSVLPRRMLRPPIA